MSYMFKSDDNVFGVCKEGGGLRKIVATLDEPITTIYAIDEPTGDLVFPVPELSKEEVDRIGDGRLGGKTQDNGYELADETNEFSFQSGFFLDYVLGDTTTIQIPQTGDYTNDFTGGVVYAISDGVDTRIVYVVGEDANGKILIDAITLNGAVQVTGTIVFITGKLYGCYVLTADAARTISITNTGQTETYLDIDTNDLISDAGTSGTYLHVIKFANTLPSFGIHGEWRNQTGANDKINDHVGVLIKSLEVTTEIKARTKQNVGWSCCRMIDDDAQQPDNPTLNSIDKPDGLDAKEIGWEDLKIMELKYNELDIITDFEDFVKAIGFTITNEYVVDQIMGNEWPKKFHASGLDLGINLTYYPTVMTLFNLKETHSKDYEYTDAKCLQLFLQWQRARTGFTDKYQVEIKRLRVKTHDKMQKPPGETIDLISECEIGKFGKNYSGSRYRPEIEVLIIDDKSGSFYSA